METIGSKLMTLRDTARLGGGEARIQRQHAKGKRTARERIAALLDDDTFVEIGMFVTHHATGFGLEAAHPWGDGVVTGSGTIDGRPVYVFAQDFTVIGGSVGAAHGRKIARVMDLAYENGVPLIGLNDSGGARIQEGVDALAAYGDIFLRNVRASGVIPQISVILGPCAGGAVYSPAITDFVFMVEETAHMFITGPEVIRTVMHEDVDFESLGGSEAHATRSGVAHFVAADEEAALAQVRWLLSYLPSNNLGPLPNVPSSDDKSRPTPELAGIVPADAQQPYDVREVVEVLVDDGEFLEVHADYAPNLVIGFARMDGHPVGIVANQPAYLAGVLDIDASDKGARFIRFCDAFHIPLLTLVDTPGFLPGIDQEHGGIIRHGAKIIYAYVEATVPKISIVTRKGYGGAYIVMGSKSLGADVHLGWPSAEIAVMGPEGAVNVLNRREIAAAKAPAARRAELVAEYREKHANPYYAAERGILDDVIEPAQTRPTLIAALRLLREQVRNVPPKKHGVMPV